MCDRTYEQVCVRGRTEKRSEGRLEVKTEPAGRVSDPDPVESGVSAWIRARLEELAWAAPPGELGLNSFLFFSLAWFYLRSI